ncbi:MAG: hypothetical protein ABIR26_01890 [Ramlibacter sp.]
MQSSLHRKWIPALAVAAVALTAVLAAVMVDPAGAHDEGALAEAPATMLKTGGQDVVKAPPLATRTMGADAACANCGVVESVVAVEGVAFGQRQTVGYLMQIRMDDGSRRLVEHRGAMAAGSRVLVEGGSLRSVPLQS